MSQHVAHRTSDEIHELRAEIERLQAALRPFARRADYFDAVLKANGGKWSDDDYYCDDPPSDIYLEQLRAAKTALEPTPGRKT